MTFEVWKDGERKFYTEEKRCIPSERIQEDQKKSGYKIKRKDERKDAKKKKGRQ